MEKWVTGTLFYEPPTIEDIKRDHAFCKECGRGMAQPRGSTELVRVERETVVNPTPLINYGPTLAESTVLGEGYHFPRIKREVSYVRVPCEPQTGGSAYDHYGKGPHDVCVECYIDQQQAKRKVDREARLAKVELTRMEATEMAYRKMWAWVVGD